jgi:hypothetical protein
MPARREHEVAGLPLVDLAANGRAPRALKVIVDRRRGVAVRAVDDFRRADRHGGEEIRRRPVGAPRQRVVEQIEAAADIVLAERLELVEMRLHLLPRPMQRLRFDGRRVDQDLIGHEPRRGASRCPQRRGERRSGGDQHVGASGREHSRLARALFPGVGARLLAPHRISSPRRPTCVARPRSLPRHRRASCRRILREDPLQTCFSPTARLLLLV